MKNLVISFFTLCLLWSMSAQAQTSMQYRKQTLERLSTKDYSAFKDSLTHQLKQVPAGKFGTDVAGVRTSFKTDRKQIAFTFDACIGKKNDYNDSLINFLRQERIPCTLFVTTSWTDGNDSIVKKLIADSLFEVENHGLFHRVCSVNGKTKYHILATQNTREVIDEMELSARNLAQLKGERPRFFRPATAFIDEKSVRIANELGMQVVNFDNLSGDAVRYTPAPVLAKQILRQAHPGAIVIMHFNHPEWYEMQALQLVIPQLRAQGYDFVRLDQVLLNK